jgi:hypothetical protein
MRARSFICGANTIAGVLPRQLMGSVAVAQLDQS